MCHEITQVGFEFGPGRIIISRVMPLALRKIPYTPSNWNSVYRRVTRLRNRQVKFEFCFGRIIFGRVISLGIRQIPIIFQFLRIEHHHFQLKFWMKMCLENTQVKFEFGSGWIIFGRAMILRLIKTQVISGCHSLSLSFMDIFNWHSEYSWVTRIHIC